MSSINYEQNHLYIISYDLDGQTVDSEKSKRLILFLREHKAVCVTKSTWLLATPSNCRSVFYTLDRVLKGDVDVFGLFRERSDSDRVFVAEITGDVFYDNLICEEQGYNPLSFSELLGFTKTVRDGFEGLCDSDVIGDGSI